MPRDYLRKTAKTVERKNQFCVPEGKRYLNQIFDAESYPTYSV